VGTEAVDEGADPDPDEDVGEDLADEVAGVGPALAEALLHRQAQVQRGGAPTGPHLEDPRLHPALDAQAPQDQPAGDGHRQPGRHVEEGDARAEEAPQEDERDLVDHGAADEEGEGDPPRDPRLHEADEEGDGGAGAERGDDPEAAAATVPAIVPRRPAPPARAPAGK